jgi:hypothetical protein
MPLEQARENSITPDNEPGTVIQVGARNVTDRTGAFRRAGMQAIGVSEGGVNGDVSATLSGQQLLRRVQEAKAKGEKNITMDLSRALDLGPDDIEAIMRFRDTLKREGVTLTITGITSKEDEALRAGGAKANGLKTFTLQNTLPSIYRRQIKA